MNIFEDKTINIFKPQIDIQKKTCVLGVLKTDEGLKIKDELLEWLTPIYNVYIVEQDAPGKLFEYPAISYMKYIQMENKIPSLYLHTKGAAHISDSQAIVRKFWKDEFTNHKDEYFSLIDTKIPTIACPFTGYNKITWLNGFVMNYEAAKIIDIPFPDRRCYYEQLCRKNTSQKNFSNIAVIGRIYNDIDVIESENEKNATKKKAANYMKKYMKNA